jgi:hypothetical protein
LSAAGGRPAKETVREECLREGRLNNWLVQVVSSNSSSKYFPNENCSTLSSKNFR